MDLERTFDAPISAPIIHVKPEWIDQNNHLNMAYYVLAFDLGIDHIWQTIGLGEAHLLDSSGSTFALQSQVHYLQEVMVNDPLRIDFQLLDFDRKRLHSFLMMYHDEKGYLAATEERITVHVDMTTRKSAPFPDRIAQKLRQMHEAHQLLPRNDRIGSFPTLKRRSS